MTLTKQLLAIVKAYCVATKTTEAGLAKTLFNDGKRLSAIADGRPMKTDTFEHAVAWLARHWPDGVPWPEGAIRPTKGWKIKPAGE